MILLQRIIKKQGFKKEQQKYILNILIDKLNGIKDIRIWERFSYNNDFDIVKSLKKSDILYVVNGDNIKISLPDTRFKINLEYRLMAILHLIKRFGGVLKSDYKPQINAVTRQEYHGTNAESLQNAGYSCNEWVGAYQARKLNKQVKKGSQGFVIKIKCFNKDDNRDFYILQTVFNTECLEPLQKIEDTAEFTEMLERLEA